MYHYTVGGNYDASTFTRTALYAKRTIARVNHYSEEMRRNV